MNRSGRHFLQIPGPTNVPDRVLRAIAEPTIDHRGPDFADLTREILTGLKHVFGTTGPVLVFPSSGSGAWEAALVNTLSPGDRVLVFENGEFARLWSEVARKLGLDVRLEPTEWGRAVDPAVVDAILRSDDHVRAVLVVHNETSTGATTNISAIRKAIDRAGHSALLLVDSVSALASMDVQHEAWGVDVTIAGSQKGLMVPPGLGLQAVSAKARAAGQTARLPRSYWAWEPMIAANETGYFTYTPAINLLFGLREALRMLDEEGLVQVYARHRRLAEAARRTVRAWGLEVLARVPEEQSSVVTTVMMPAGHDADAFRRLALEELNLSLGAGLGKLRGKAFRIGHIGYFNELMLAGTLAGVEMSLRLSGVPVKSGGVDAAMTYLTETARAAAAHAT